MPMPGLFTAPCQHADRQSGLLVGLRDRRRVGEGASLRSAADGLCAWRDHGVLPAEISRRQTWADQHAGGDPVSVHRCDPSQQTASACRHARNFFRGRHADGELSTGRRMDLQLGDGDEQLSSIRRRPVRSIHGKRLSKSLSPPLCVRNDLCRIRD
jgi:hypothetical protein